MNLRVLHWNVHSWRDAGGASNVTRIADLIRDTEPDVVSLVEVNEPWGAPEALASIAAETGYGWVFVPSIQFGEPPGRRGYGNALLSRVPVSDVQQVDVFTPPGSYDGSEESEKRSAVVARVGSTWVGSTHFPAGSRRARKAAAAALLELLRGLSTPWIVCGDFNAAPSALFAGRTDLLRVHPDSGTPTFPAHRPRVPIDYFLTSPDVSVSASVLAAGGSDHLPVLGRCRMPQPLTDHDHDVVA